MFLLNVPLALFLFAPLMDAFAITAPIKRLAFNVSAGAIILFFVSTLCYLYVERPFLVGKKRQGVEPQRPVAAVAGTK
jgi:hypothetical protein